MLDDKDDKENASAVLGSSAFDRGERAGVESTEQSADQENEEGLDSSLMMPQILSSPYKRNSEKRAYAVERALAAREEEMQARPRRRSRGDRNRSGNQHGTKR